MKFLHISIGRKGPIFEDFIADNFWDFNFHLKHREKVFHREFDTVMSATQRKAKSGTLHRNLVGFKKQQFYQNCSQLGIIISVEKLWTFVTN